MSNPPRQLEPRTSPQTSSEDNAPEDNSAELVVVCGPSWEEAAEYAQPALQAGVAVVIWPAGADVNAADVDAAPVLEKIQRLGGRISQVSAEKERLTTRERQILTLIAAGVSNKGIARELGVSPNTVKFHLSTLFSKLGVTKRAEAIAAAARRGELAL